jgi:hypothetical protein
LAATDSVAWLNSAANGTMANTETTNSNVCDSGELVTREQHRDEHQQPEQPRCAGFLSKMVRKVLRSRFVLECVHRVRNR